MFFCNKNFFAIIFFLSTVTKFIEICENLVWLYITTRFSIFKTSKKCTLTIKYENILEAKVA